MKYLRFSDRGTPRYGILEQDMVTILEGDPFSPNRPTSETVGLEGLQLLAPCEPSKIIGIGLNYKEHAREVGAELPAEPRFFFKPPTSIVGPGADIVWPAMSSRVDYEAELAVVMGKRAKGVSSKEALSYVLGYSCGNDITARDLQQRDKLMNRAKAFDTFGPLGPAIVTGLDPSDLKIECYLNDQLKQSDTTADMIFGVPELVSFLSQIMTLLPGDVIFTGALPGIGPMQAGDQVEVRIEGIGTLRNRLVRPAAR